MRLIQSLAILLPIFGPAAAAPLEQSAAVPQNISPLQAQIQAELVRQDNLAGADGCVVQAYKGWDCSGNPGNGFNYVVDGCRSCRQFDDSHSFFLSGNCPRGHLVTHDNDCSAFSKGSYNVNFGGTGCWNVNTGHNWVSAYPCFDK
ncbi:hypothetical protein B0H63DRAFT_561762 [Podospora didyma]|uniref:Cyanovirin-N domain-containing protein n=1 Tax=Podospora didyma TaxID=330526 RepID=A0AAE0KJV4_9PEZI|nr:hypothetical protein B0H63DRAFT_561762 [Podospora didyma]